MTSEARTVPQRGDLVEIVHPDMPRTRHMVTHVEPDNRSVWLDPSPGCTMRWGHVRILTEERPQPYLHLDGMTWPNPAHIMGEEGLAWRLRYGHASDADLRVAASAVVAYVALVDASEATRNRTVASLRALDGRD